MRCGWVPLPPPLHHHKVKLFLQAHSFPFACFFLHLSIVHVLLPCSMYVAFFSFSKKNKEAARLSALSKGSPLAIYVSLLFSCPSFVFFCPAASLPLPLQEPAPPPSSLCSGSPLAIYFALFVFLPLLCFSLSSCFLCPSRCKKPPSLFINPLCLHHRHPPSLS